MLQTVALELVPTPVDGGVQQAIDEAHKFLRLATDFGLQERIKHLLIPGIIAEDQGRPVEVREKMDVLDFWSVIKPELPTVQGLCTQVTAFSDQSTLTGRLQQFITHGIDGVVFVGVPRTMSDGQGEGVSPVDALDIFSDLVPNRGVILIPTRDDESSRLGFKCQRGATFAMTQLLYSQAIVEFLTRFSREHAYRPEVLLSFGFVPTMESSVGLINWLIQDPGNQAVAAEQEFVKVLAASDQDRRRELMVDLYKRVIDQVINLGFPLSLHLEAAYGISPAAFRTFAQMLDYWSPETS